MTVSELIFIVNPMAANGKSFKIWGEVKQFLDNEGIDYEFYLTKYPNHAIEITERIAQELDCRSVVVAVGGDGTIHEVINGLKTFPDTKIAFIPAGSGNDFSRGYSIPKDPLSAIQLIINNKANISLIDIGNCRIGKKQISTLFVNSVGVGFDAVVSKVANQSKLKKYLNLVGLGGLIYIVALLKVLFVYKPTNVKLMIDDRHFQYKNVWFITVSNQQYYGGGMKISPAACPNDGLLNIMVIHEISPLKILMIFGSVFFGKHIHFSQVKQHIGKSITIEPELPIPVHADGELIGHSPVYISIETKKQPLISVNTE